MRPACPAGHAGLQPAGGAEETVPDVGLHGAFSRMKLSAIIQGTGARGDVGGDPEIARVTGDSREVVPGALFFALTGTARDGHDFAAEAARRGAVAVIAERPVACDTSSSATTDLALAGQRDSAAVPSWVRA